MMPAIAGVEVVHFANAPLSQWKKKNLLQGCAWARDPKSGKDYLFIAQAQSGGAGAVEDAIFHRHVLTGDKLTYVDTMVGRRFGHPQSFHVRISKYGNPYIWGSIQQYRNNRRNGAKVARFPYKGNRTITSATHGFEYMSGLSGHTLAPVSCPEWKIVVRRAGAVSDTYTEYRERDVRNGHPKALRSFTRLRGSGTYQSSAADADQVIVIKGATTQHHMVYQHRWSGRAYSKRDVTHLRAPTGPNTSSEPEAVAKIRGDWYIGKRFNSPAHRLYAIFSLEPRRIMTTIHPKDKISPKVIAATVAAVLVPGILASLSYVGAHQQELFGGLPPVVVVAIAAILPGLATFVSSYAKNDPLRKPVTTEKGGLYDKHGAIVSEPKRAAAVGDMPGED